MGQWFGVRIDIEGVNPDEHARLTEALRLWGAEETTWTKNDVSSYQGNDHIYDKEGRVVIYRDEAPKWPKPFGLELDKDEYDCFYFDLRKLSRYGPTIVIEVTTDFWGEAERLTFVDGKTTKRETLDWVVDVEASV